VQRQLGHASIQLTVDTYGKWLPIGNKAAVNQLDDRNGSKMVARTASATPDAPEVADSIGGPSRTRTLAPLIKSSGQRMHSPDANELNGQQHDLWPESQ